MRRTGPALIIAAILIVVVLVIGGVYWYLHRPASPTENVPARQGVTSTEPVNQASFAAGEKTSTTFAGVIPSSTVPSSTTDQAVSCVNVQPSGSGYPNANFQFNGKMLAPGANTINGITFTVLPVYDIWQLDQSNGSKCYSFNNFAFTASCDQRSPCRVTILKNGNVVATPNGFGSLEYGPISAKTFSYNGRDYFIFHGTENCGTGGCNDDTDIFSNKSNGSTAPFLLWDNSWGWGDSAWGQQGWGDEDAGALSFVAGYQGNTFIFPAGGSIIELDANGNRVFTINPSSSSITDILQGGNSAVDVIPAFIGEPIAEALTSFTNASSGDVINFSGGNGSTTSTQVLSVTLNGKSIGQITGFVAAVYGFSPDNRYFAFRMSQGSNFIFDAYVIDLANKAIIDIPPQVQSVPYPTSSLSLRSLTPHIESLSWDGNALDVYSYLLGNAFTTTNLYYRVSPEEEWRYYFIDGSYRFVQRFGMQAALASGWSRCYYPDFGFLVDYPASWQITAPGNAEGTGVDNEPVTCGVTSQLDVQSVFHFGSGESESGQLSGGMTIDTLGYGMSLDSLIASRGAMNSLLHSTLLATSTFNGMETATLSNGSTLFGKGSSIYTVSFDSGISTSTQNAVLASFRIL